VVFGRSWTEVGLKFRIEADEQACDSRVRAEAPNDFPSLLARVRVGAEVVIERNAEAVACFAQPRRSVRLLSESLRLAKDFSPPGARDGPRTRGASSTVDLVERIGSIT
jgi:antitoxin (DNA-binding transcriptional repressor) of toxin-antitoxin stability system